MRWALLMVAVGCGGSQKGHSPPELTITVAEAGAEPRRQLRYELVAHVPERAESTVKLVITTASTNTVLEKGQTAIDFPSIEVASRIEVSGFGPRGAEVTAEVEGVTVLDDVVDPAVRKLVVKDVAAFHNVRASWRMAPSGRVTDVEVQSTIRSQLAGIADSIRQGTVVFPDVEIGIGARWEVTSREAMAGVMWNRSVRYHLKALTDSTATVDAEIVMAAPAQDLSVEPKATTKLTSGKATESAELFVPLHRLVVTATTRSRSEVNLAIVRGSLRITSTVLTELLSSVKPL